MVPERPGPVGQPLAAWVLLPVTPDRELLRVAAPQGVELLRARHPPEGDLVLQSAAGLREPVQPGAELLRARHRPEADLEL